MGRPVVDKGCGENIYCISENLEHTEKVLSSTVLKSEITTPKKGGDFTPIDSVLFLGYSFSLLSPSGPGVHLQVNSILPDLT